MSAFLKIDRCGTCSQELPWELVPEIVVAGRPLAGTGVWKSRLLHGSCPTCVEAAVAHAERERRAEERRATLVRLLGGIKPYREFTFERYVVTPGNKAAFEQAKQFDPSRRNLYLWGPCGVGKTHLAVATLRACSERGDSIAFVTLAQLIRKLRMKTPEEEQQAIDHFVGVTGLVLDDLGGGGETPYARQILQEILDARAFNERGGLIVTTPHSLSALAYRLGNWSVPSRLAGMCHVIEIRGNDHRRARRHSDD